MLVVFALLTYFTFSGTVVTALCLREQLQTRHLLIAPTVGIAIQILLTIALSRLFNLPIQAFCRLLFLGIFLIDVVCAVYFVRIPLITIRRSLPFWLIAIICILLVGWPLFQFGLDWLSYANNDMVNYSLSADHLIHNGFYTKPALNGGVADNSNITDVFYMYLQIERYGVDALLGSIASTLNIIPLRAFMPIIVTFDASLVLATAFLAFRHDDLRKAAIFAALFATISPLTVLGTIYQLFAQVIGLALCAVTLGLAADMLAAPRRHQFPYVILTAIALAGACAAYPEVTPFIFFPVGAYLLVIIVLKRSTFTLAVPSIAQTLLGTAILMNLNIKTYLIVLSERLTAPIGNALSNRAFLFPFYLIPTGFANLTGIYPIADYPLEPKLSAGIAIGLAISILSILIGVRVALKPSISAFAFLFSVVLGLYLFRKSADFGLYKLAMYIQPFAIATIATFCTRTASSRVVIGA